MKAKHFKKYILDIFIKTIYLRVLKNYTDIGRKRLVNRKSKKGGTLVSEQLGRVLFAVYAFSGGRRSAAAASRAPFINNHYRGIPVYGRSVSPYLALAALHFGSHFAFWLHFLEKHFALPYLLNSGFMLIDAVMCIITDFSLSLLWISIGVFTVEETYV